MSLKYYIQEHNDGPPQDQWAPGQCTGRPIIWVGLLSYSSISFLYDGKQSGLYIIRFEILCTSTCFNFNASSYINSLPRQLPQEGNG